MLGRVLRPASAVRPTGDAAFLVFRIGRHRQSLLGVTGNHCPGAVTVLHIYDLLPPRNLPRMSRASLYSERSEVRSNLAAWRRLVSSRERSPLSLSVFSKADKRARAV